MLDAVEAGTGVDEIAARTRTSASEVRVALARLEADGHIVRGCLTLAVQCDGRRVDTIEGLSDAGTLTALQDAFHLRNAAQCGFCTPGMLVAAQDLVEHHPAATREQIREHLSGNYCRCTGYQAIVDAIEDVLAAKR